MIHHFLIKTSYQTISLQSSCVLATEVLLETPFLVVLDSSKKFAGIVNTIDLFKNKTLSLEETLLERTKINIFNDIETTYTEICNSTFAEFPVYNKDLFVGVLSKEDLKNYLAVTRGADEKIKDLVKINTDLETSNKIKDELFAIMAHNLRGPFNGLIGFTSILKDTIGTIETATAKEYLSYIYTSANNALEVLDKLIDWGKTQLNLFAYKPTDLQLSLITSEVITLFETSIVLKEISLTTHIPSEIKLETDEEMLKTVLRNLISNAVKFTKDKGEIRLNATVNSGAVTITVSDNGIGISPKNSALLFHKHLLTTGTKGEKGLGVGLLLTTKIVTQLGGKISCTSNEETGSVFKVELPLQYEKK